ncbi:MAG: DUF6695 family protein, partial [Schleiferiaceae bacterium]
AQWLGGLGEGAWFDISEVDGHSFKGKKFDKMGQLEHEALYSNNEVEVPASPKIAYASHYGFFSIEHDEVVHRFYRKS